MTLQPGEHLGPFTILSMLGSGGMGEVYLAEDTRLGRQVAVKVLPQELLKDQARRKRFLREARAAAAVDHPNVVHIYEVEEQPDGRVYLVMQHVEGKTIRQLLLEGGLDPERCLGVAGEVADALAAAHARGVVHRDIKPDNIMVDGAGHARILDFGLARLLEGETPHEPATQVETKTRQTTSAGAVMGTMAYMSPEQARGAEVDGRSDIFSFGVTLYEMMAGKHPFAGRTGVETVDSLLNKDPKPVGSIVGGLPPETGWVLSKMLAKKPEDRYQSAKELLVDLRKLRHSTSISGPQHFAGPSRGRRPAWLVPVAAIAIAVIVVFVLVRRGRGTEGGLQDAARPAGSPSSAATPGPGAHPAGAAAGLAPATGKIRLAVLPLQNVRKDARIDFLGYALADATISKLSYLEGLTVRPSSFVQRYRESPPEDPQEAGRALNVEHLLTGSLLAEGGDLRINVQFVDLQEGSVRWEETIDAKLDNLLSVQDEVVSRIVERMRLKLSPEEEARLASDRPHNEEAYALYLRSLAQPDSREGIHEAIRLAERSIALEGDFAPAWSQLGRRKYDLVLYTPDGTRKDYDDALEAQLRAGELNPDHPMAMQGLSVQLTERGRHEEAYRKIRAWIDAHPRVANGYFSLSYLYRYAGLLDESARELERALLLDSGNPGFRSGAASYFYQADLERAERFFALDPDSRFVLMNRPIALAIAGELTQLRALVEERTRTRGPVETPYPRAMLAMLRGDTDEARRLMREAASGRRSPDPESLYHVGASAAWVGLVDEPLDLLRSAVEGGFYCYPLFEIDKRLDGLRGRPEFQRILDRARSRMEAFKAFVAAER